MKTIPHMRPSILAAALAVGSISGFAQSQTVKLMDYFYPIQQGASWTYQGTGWGGYAADEKVAIARTDWSLNLYTGRNSPKSYRKTVARFRFERSYNGGGGDLWYEYFGNGSTFNYGNFHLLTFC